MECSESHSLSGIFNWLLQAFATGCVQTFGHIDTKCRDLTLKAYFQRKMKSDFFFIISLKEIFLQDDTLRSCIFHKATLTLQILTSRWLCSFRLFVLFFLLSFKIPKTLLYSSKTPFT